ncbi:MAG: FecR family protein [Desulfomicrobium sp.]|nr:FecR family protein [Desulfomicrobium sp.]
MKPVQLGALIVLFLSAGFCSSAYSSPRVGLVIGFDQEAWAMNNGMRRELVMKSEVFATDTIVTDATGKVQILFEDDSVISLGPSSSISIEQFSFGSAQSPAMSIKLVQGLSRFVSGKVVEQNPEGFTISSPLAVIGIRGTITQHNIQSELESHYVEQLDPGHVVTIQGPDGHVLEFFSSLTGVDLRPGMPTPREPRPMIPNESQRGQQETQPGQLGFDPQHDLEAVDRDLEPGITPSLVEIGVSSAQEHTLPHNDPPDPDSDFDPDYIPGYDPDDPDYIPGYDPDDPDYDPNDDPTGPGGQP